MISTRTRRRAANGTHLSNALWHIQQAWRFSRVRPPLEVEDGVWASSTPVWASSGAWAGGGAGKAGGAGRCLLRGMMAMVDVEEGVGSYAKEETDGLASGGSGLISRGGACE